MIAFGTFFTFLETTICVGHIFFLNSAGLVEKERKWKNSFEKLEKIRDLCGEYPNIHMEPKRIYGNVLVIPLLTWYDCSFDKDVTDDEYKDLLENFIVDYNLCKFDSKLTWKCFKGGISEFFLKKNKIPEIKKGDFVITFSHFLPRTDLVPDPKILRYKERLLKVLGSSEIDTFIRKLKSQTHIFGHSHISVDACIDGVRYIQNNFKRYHLKKDVLQYPIFEVYDNKRIVYKKLKRNIQFVPENSEKPPKSPTLFGEDEPEPEIFDEEEEGESSEDEEEGESFEDDEDGDNYNEYYYDFGKEEEEEKYWDCSLM